ncbi:hypothetical protein AB4254_09395 [Vibrio breoganii]
MLRVFFKITVLLGFGAGIEFSYMPSPDYDVTPGEIIDDESAVALLF